MCLPDDFIGIEFIVFFSVLITDKIEYENILLSFLVSASALTEFFVINEPSSPTLIEDKL